MDTIRRIKTAGVVSVALVLVAATGLVIAKISHQSFFNEHSSPQSKTLTPKTPNTATSSLPEQPQTQYKTEDLGDLGKPFAQPNVQEQMLVWLGNPRGVGHNPDTVYLMDLSSKKRGSIATTQYKESAYLLSPQVNKSWAAWLDYGAEKAGAPLKFSVYVMNLSTQKVVKVTTFNATQAGFPWLVMRGDELIWSEMVDNDHALIRMCNVKTMKISTVTKVGTKVLPAVYRDGDQLVWQSGESGSDKSFIKVFNLSTNQITLSQEIEGRFSYPKINSHYVLYSPQVTDDSRTDLELLDLDTKKTTDIQATNHYYWDLGNGFLTWSQHDDQTSNVYVKSIDSSSSPVKIGEGYLPFAAGNQIIWQSIDYKHVYLTEITK